MLEQLDMRRDVQEIFKATPHEKQVMMFSATLADEMRAVCKKFMQDPMEIYVDDSKLTLHGLQQHYVKLAENEKNRKLNELLDALEFNQVVVFVKSVQRAISLDKLLQECNFPSVAIHASMKQEERIKMYQLQGLQAPHPRLHRHLGTRYRHRARQHRRQLRHARLVRLVPPPCWPRRTFRYQGSRHHLCFLRGRRQDLGAGPVTLRGLHHAAPRAD